MPAAAPRVFTIPAGVSFLPTLADALLDGRLGPVDRSDPLALAGVTVLLPTRRAVRAFREVLIGRLGGEAAILPVIRPIGDIDEEDHLLDPLVEAGEDWLVLPPVISRLARQLALTRLTLAWGRAVRRDILALDPDEPLRIPASAADATRLAIDLARLLDDIEAAGVSWDAISRLVPEDHARYFQITLDFLRIVAKQWPAYLDEAGRVDPAERRDRLIRAAAARLAARPPDAPVIAAGSTGSVPATAELLGVVSRLPTGAVVLPGLDQTLDEAGWNAIGEPATAEAPAFGHPQFGLKQLISAIGIVRHDVEPIAEPAPALLARVAALSDAMRPAETIDAWAERQRTEGAQAGDAFAGVDLLVARNEQEEALAVALAIREAVETPDATAALVTPDRTLARRVAAELGRWGLAIDDSAGAPLDREPAGVFARLAASVAADADPVDLLALLKHPFAAFGMERATCRRAARVLEIAVLRGHRVVGGLAGLKPALAKAKAETTAEDRRHVPRERRRLFDDDWQRAESLVQRLVDTFGPMETAFTGDGGLSVARAASLLLTTLDAAATERAGPTAPLWQGPAGEALATLLTGLVEDPESEGLTLEPAEMPFFLAALMADVAVQRPAGADPRIHIWGVLEARLQSVDLLVIGGLDEGTWPSGTRTDPWLSRAMRAGIGLPPPERRLGLAAHDFVQAMAAPRVVASRAERRGGAPSVESRWLQRLRAVAGAEEMEAMAARGRRLVEIARALDRVGRDEMQPVARPAPTPPIAARPDRLSITEIETLIRDPYAIYAKKVLGLEPLEDLGLAPDRALRGTLIHDALARFTSEWSGAYGDAAATRLIAIGDEVLAAIADFPEMRAVWSIRFGGIARWFVGWEALRAEKVAARNAEIDGELAFPLADGSAFTLRGRADRIDLMRDGTVTIYDFKSGTPQTERTVFAGLTPQMALEAAMVRAGGFGEHLKGRSVSDLAWLAVGRVGRQDPYESAAKKDQKPDDLAERAHRMFAELVAAFADAGTPYLSRARPMMERARYLGDYDHLARVREWALVESEEEVQ